MSRRNVEIVATAIPFHRATRRRERNATRTIRNRRLRRLAPQAIAESAAAIGVTPVPLRDQYQREDYLAAVAVVNSLPLN